VTGHCIIVLQSMFIRLELDTLFYSVWLPGLTILLMHHYLYTPFGWPNALHMYDCLCYCFLNFMIFLFTDLYLHDWVTSLWSCTCVIVYWRHLASFYVLVGLLLTTLDCMFRSRSVERSGPFHGGSGFPCGAGGLTVDHSRSASFWPDHENPFLRLLNIFLYFSTCKSYFCASLWCNTPVTLYHSLW